MIPQLSSPQPSYSTDYDTPAAPFMKEDIITN